MHLAGTCRERAADDAESTMQHCCSTTVYGVRTLVVTYTHTGRRHTRSIVLRNRTARYENVAREFIDLTTSTTVTSYEILSGFISTNLSTCMINMIDLDRRRWHRRRSACVSHSRSRPPSRNVRRRSTSNVG